MLKISLRLFIAALAVVTLSGVANAQEIGTGGVIGTVRDSSGLPVVGAIVTVAGTTIVIETDDAGQFRLAKAQPGELSIRVKRLGFLPDTARVTVMAGETRPVTIVLAPVPLTLKSVVVNGRREASGPMGGFYRRMSQGIGRFITREQIERRNSYTMTDLLRGTAGLTVTTTSIGQKSAVRFRGAGPACAPLTIIDGTAAMAGEFDLNTIDPLSLAGIEIYSGVSTVPAEFSRNSRISGSTCGTIVLWTKMPERTPRKPKAGQRSAAALIDDLVAQRSIFTAGEVDSPARPDSTDIVRPIYPDSLFENMIGGRAVVEFVVSADGDVVMETFNVVSTTHVRFADAVRLAMEDQKFIPARRRGAAVPQVVHLPFDFVPDSSFKRRR